MTDDTEAFGPQSLDRDIKRLEKKMTTLELVKDLCNSLEEKTEIVVHNDPSSYHIDITVTSPKPVGEMQQLANIDRNLLGQAHRPSNIVYDHKNDEYKLDVKFKVE